MKHVIFYDAKCLLCTKAIEFIYERDKKKRFAFAPLDGEMAKQYGIKKSDTLILMQNYRSKKKEVLIEGKGVLRIFWLLGGMYKLLGILSFLPSIPFDFFYRFIAKRRYLFFRKH